MELRPYQIEGVKFLVNRRRAILGDVPGAGKTVQAILAAKTLGVVKILIVCPKIAFGVWENEVKKWLGTDGETFAYSGPPTKRASSIIKFKASAAQLRFLISNYSLVKELVSSTLWDLVILDEPHRVMRRRTTQAFAAARGLRSRYFFILDGTLVRKGPQDLWTFLNLVDPVNFNSYWRWVNTHCHVIKTPFGVSIEGPRNPAATQVVLRPYILRRTKEQVLPELPPKQRAIIPIEMGAEQRALYDGLADQMMSELSDGKILLTPNVVSQITRLRQILVTPALVGSSAPSAALEALTEQVADEQESGNEAVVVFTPFAEAIPYIAESLSFITPSIGWVRGGLKHEELSNVVEWFRTAKGPRVLICSILSSTSFNASVASVAYFVGFDWDVDNNEQAEDRLHRFGQRNFVRINYLTHKGTVEDHISDLLDRKLTWTELTLNPNKLLRGMRK